MNGPVYFERLVASVERIARHTYFLASTRPSSFASMTSMS